MYPNSKPCESLKIQREIVDKTHDIVIYHSISGSLSGNQVGRVQNRGRIRMA